MSNLKQDIEALLAEMDASISRSLLMLKRGQEILDSLDSPEQRAFEQRTRHAFANMDTVKIKAPIVQFDNLAYRALAVELAAHPPDDFTDVWEGGPK